MCLWNILPKERKFERYGKEQLSYDIFGRLHLDYLQLYRKYTYHEMPSYSLDSIGEYELKERKVAYQGSLDDLYNNDFETFIEYNRQDTMLLDKLDKKLKFISLANTLAHEICIPIPTTMGAVGLTDQAIVLESHDRGFVVPDRLREDDSSDYDYYAEEDSEESSKKLSEEEIQNTLKSTIAGAYVANPKRGLSRWIGSIDVTSLYPSVIMALNISPETLVGQLDQANTKKMLVEKMRGGSTFADAWANVFSSLEADEIFNKTINKVQIDFEYARKKYKSVVLSGREAHTHIFNNDLCISANGTIFNQETLGIVPGLLERWFKERKEMQTKAKELKKLSSGIELPDELKDL